MKFVKWYRLFIGCLLTILLSGCVTTRMTIQMNANGSVDFEQLVSVNRSEAQQELKKNPMTRDQQISPGYFSNLLKQRMTPVAEQNKMILTEFAEGNTEGVRLSIHAKDVQEAQEIYSKAFNSAANTIGAQPAEKKLQLDYKRGFFADTMKIAITIGKIQQEPAANNSKEPAMQFAVKFPVTFTKSNCTRKENGGRTLVWEINPKKDQQIHAEAFIMHPFPIFMVILVILAAFIFIIIRVKQVKSPLPPSRRVARRV